MLLPYNIDFLQKILQAVPIAEEGFKRDPSGQSAEARRYLDQANKKFPELPTYYFICQTIASMLGQNNLKYACNLKCIALQPKTVTGLTDCGRLVENLKQYDRALALYRAALSTKKQTIEDLIKEYSEARNGAAPKPDFFGMLPKDPKESYADARAGEARMLVYLKRYPEATKALGIAVDYYLAESHRVPERFGNEKLKASMSSLYALRAQALRALNKPGLAKEDDRMSRSWETLNMGPDHFSVRAAQENDAESQ
jgi:tetratricopeptide (TPR) repeat protein